VELWRFDRRKDRLLVRQNPRRDPGVEIPSVNPHARGDQEHSVIGRRPSLEDFRRKEKDTENQVLALIAVALNILSEGVQERLNLALLDWRQVVVVLADRGGFSGVALDGRFGAGGVAVVH
jgi:hypothetical protein